MRYNLNMLKNKGGIRYLRVLIGQELSQNSIQLSYAQEHYLECLIREFIFHQQMEGVLLSDVRYKDLHPHYFGYLVHKFVNQAIEEVPPELKMTRREYTELIR